MASKNDQIAPTVLYYFFFFCMFDFFRQVSKKAVVRRDFLDILLKSLCRKNN